MTERIEMRLKRDCLGEKETFSFMFFLFFIRGEAKGAYNIYIYIYVIGLEEEREETN